MGQPRLTGKSLYEAHWEATFEMLSWALPFWEDLPWQERIKWEDRAVEQSLRDRGTLPRGEMPRKEQR